MSDDFGTVNVRRGDRAREIEVLRQHYRHHRDSLAGMIADAPTEHLAAEYRRLVQEIDLSIAKLDEIEGRPSEPGMRPSEPGMRPLVTPEEPASIEYDDADAAHDSRSRLALIVVAALIVLAAIGWLIWRSSADRRAPGGEVVEQTTDTATATATTTAVAEETAAPIAPSAPAVLVANPGALEFGVLRKGTRAVRQLEIANNSDEPVTIQVARSACRCLFYAHAPVVPPKAKETLTVTVDGARAKAGELRETIAVTAKGDSTIATTFDVNATVR